MRDSSSGGALTETTFLILLAFCNPLHGYGVINFVKEKTLGRINLGAGTVYGAINNLLKKGWIKTVDSNGQRNKTTYVITENGYRILSTELLRLQVICSIAEKILDDNRNSTGSAIR